MIYCHDLQARYDDCPYCCSSCHEDEEYGYDLCGDYDQWTGVLVCCTVMEWLKETFPEGVPSA